MVGEESWSLKFVYQCQAHIHDCVSCIDPFLFSFTRLLFHCTNSCQVRGQKKQGGPECRRKWAHAQQVPPGRSSPVWRRKKIGRENEREGKPWNFSQPAWSNWRGADEESSLWGLVWGAGFREAWGCVWLPCRDPASAGFVSIRVVLIVWEIQNCHPIWVQGWVTKLIRLSMPLAQGSQRSWWSCPPLGSGRSGSSSEDFGGTASLHT